jgi:hypothetical protein
MIPSLSKKNRCRVAWQRFGIFLIQMKLKSRQAPYGDANYNVDNYVPAGERHFPEYH